MRVFAAFREDVSHLADRQLMRGTVLLVARVLNQVPRVNYPGQLLMKLTQYVADAPHLGVRELREDWYRDHLVAEAFCDR